MNKFQEEIDRLAKAGITCLEQIDLKPDYIAGTGGCSDVLILGDRLRFYARDSTSIVAKRTIDKLLGIRNLIDNQINMLAASMLGNSKFVLAMKEHNLLKANYAKAKERVKELEDFLSAYKED